MKSSQDQASTNGTLANVPSKSGNGSAIDAYIILHALHAPTRPSSPRVSRLTRVSATPLPKNPARSL